MNFKIILISTFLFIYNNSYSQIVEVTKRIDFYQKFEPKNHVINGVGQSTISSLDSFVLAINDTNLRPMIYMDYTGLKNKSKEDTNIYNFQNNIRNLKSKITKYSWSIVPQIGLSMTNDGNPETHYEQDVAAGKYDHAIKLLAKELKDYKSPIYLRIGYEFNGPWNGYKADTYKKAWIKIINEFRKQKVNNVAVVWCMAVDATKENYNFMDFYPGDQYVDWWGIDIFSKSHFKNPILKKFMDSSLVHKKPVMIGECSPRYSPVQAGEYSWKGWFEPYFNFIYSNPNVKATCYINWNWDKTPWPDWGDGSLENGSYVRDKFREQLKNPLFIHGLNEKKTKEILRTK